MLALGVYFQQQCSSAGRMFVAYRSRLNTTEQLVQKKKPMKCFVNWIPPRIRVLSRNANPAVKQTYIHG